MPFVASVVLTFTLRGAVCDDWCRVIAEPLMSSRLVALGIVLAATASAAELKVTQYDGPTECDEANKVKSGDLLGMHYTGTIVCSFFSTHHLAFACGACPTAAH